MPLPEEGDMAHRLAEATGIYHVITEMMRLYRMSLETFQGLPTCFPLCHTEDGGKPTPPTPTKQVCRCRNIWTSEGAGPPGASRPSPLSVPFPVVSFWADYQRNPVSKLILLMNCK